MKISIVTPCLNSERYLRDTIGSVISSRGDFELEYIVVDGGSTDSTIEIVKSQEPHLARWVSEKDKGLYDAIAKGFEMSSGEIMAWINSDDLYFPWTLDLVTRLFAAFPQVEWISTLTPTSVDAGGDIAKIRRLAGFAKRAFLDGVYVGFGGVGDPRSADFIQQESTFWRRSLWDKAEGPRVLRAYRLAGDFALWSAFVAHADLHGIEAPLGAFRVRDNQLSTSNVGAYLDEVRAALGKLRRRSRYAPPSQTIGAAKYQGKYLLKDRLGTSEGRWIIRECEFAALPHSDLKKAIYFGQIF